MTSDFITLTTEQGRVRININTSSGSYVTVTRQHPSGRTVNVRGMTLAPLSGGLFVGWDWELPIGVPVVYSAYAYDDAAGRVLAAQSNSVLISWDTDSDWLKDPLEPGRNLPIRVVAAPAQSYSLPVGIHPVINRPDPVAVGVIRQTSTGSVQLLTMSTDEADRMDYITASGHPLLFQSTQSTRFGNMYFQPTDVQEEPVGAGLKADPIRIWTIGYQRVGIPVGDPAAPVTLQDVYDAYPLPDGSLQDIADAWPSLITLYEGLAGAQQPTIVTWRGQ